MTPQAIFDRMIQDGDVVLDRLDRHAEDRPDKLFVHHGDSDTGLSYAAFRHRADPMAAGLAALGVAPGDHVAVHSRDALTTAVAMFAIWRAGGVFAPVNYNLTGDFLTYQLADTAPKVLIADAAGVAAIAAQRAGMPDFVLVGPGGDVEAPEGDTVPRVALGPFSPAALIYTSGTTGPAKGVKLGHRWINQYCFNPRVLNTAEDVMHCDLPLYHVGGAFSLLARAAWLGASCGLWDRFSATTYWDRIAGLGASVTTLLDVMVPHVMSQPERPDDSANTLNKIHIQPYTPRHHAFAERFGIDFMTVGFGQTESGSSFSAIIDEFPDRQATPAALWKGLSKDDYRATARALGRPLFDGATDLPKGLMGAPSPLFEVAVLDDEDSPVAEGQPGQFCLRPRFPGLILQEYINKPEATAKVLRNCWFHTGDAIRRIDAERDLHAFVDRMGGFFRVRGENVSSFEVESAMLRLPEVRAAAAIPVPARAGEEDDIAVFLELEAGRTLDEAAVRAHAQAAMPRYMQPQYIRFVAALPVTPTSKIEKYKLRTALMAELGEREERA